MWEYRERNGGSRKCGRNRLKPCPWNEDGIFLCRICGSHSAGYEEYYLLGYNAV
jgi:hypothetical protein